MNANETKSATLSAEATATASQPQPSTLVKDSECDRLWQSALECEVDAVVPQGDFKDSASFYVVGAEDRRTGKRKTYTVTVMKDAGVTPFSCDCRYASSRRPLICKHAVATAQELNEKNPDKMSTEELLFLSLFKPWTKRNAPQLWKRFFKRWAS